MIYFENSPYEFEVGSVLFNKWNELALVIGSTIDQETIILLYVHGDQKDWHDNFSHAGVKRLYEMFQLDEAWVKVR